MTNRIQDIVKQAPIYTLVIPKAASIGNSNKKPLLSYIEKTQRTAIAPTAPTPIAEVQTYTATIPPAPVPDAQAPSAAIPPAPVPDAQAPSAATPPAPVPDAQAPSAATPPAPVPDAQALTATIPLPTPTPEMQAPAPLTQQSAKSTTSAPRATTIPTTPIAATPKTINELASRIQKTLIKPIGLASSATPGPIQKTKTQRNV